MSLKPRDRRIVLTQAEWLYQPKVLLGRGAFGKVFQGAGLDGREVAVKQLDATGLGLTQREMRIADELVGHSYSHIIPILDFGVDRKTGGYFIVMPRADHDLHAFVVANGPQDPDQALQILEHIALGLLEVNVVHRDLKPRNVLLHAGSWKVADFGIARFVEERTSAHTLKQNLTAEYAAPEQWRMTTATKATDIYALGCIAHFVLTGAPPFSGPDREDFARQHLEVPPPDLPVDGGVRQLITACLEKVAAARPEAKSLVARLRALKQGSGITINAKLLEVGALQAKEQAEARAAAAARERILDDRKELAKRGSELLTQEIADLVSSIKEAVPAAQLREDVQEIWVRNGLLFWGGVPPIGVETFSRSGKRIVCGAVIGVTQPGESYPGRSANLWYADWEGTGSYRWWEVAYFSMTGTPRISPFGVNSKPDLERVDQAHGPGIGIFQVDGMPTPIDGEHKLAFMKRWQDRLAEAAERPLGPAPERW